jgi:hypothetical protein
MTRIDTALYVLAHGRAPKGFGYWAFESANEPHLTYRFRGTYSEAKRAAISWAKANNHAVLFVCS